MPDPHEGVDPDGFVTTGVDRTNLRRPFLGAVEDAVGMCRERCSPGHGLYVYGSVATGQARVGVSDLDLLLVVALADDLARVADVGPALSERHAGTFREVSLATATETEILADTVDGHAGRCFLKHYCICVHGVDLTDRLPRCRPSRALAAGFGAQTAETLERIRADLAGAARDDLDGLARASARKLLLTCAAIVSVRGGGWTTDRQLGAAELAAHHPDRAADLERALRWSDPGARLDVAHAELHEFVHDFGGWVLATFEETTRP